MCPENKYLEDGGACNNDKSYCYQGKCNTHDDACEFLWGNDAKMSQPSCFDPNTKEATEWAGCGMFLRLRSPRLTKKYDLP